ncbi:MAG: SDR family oxidoreductase [Chloroflexota bacterium]|nr:SDR family oxidoreductase [Chloroflexota bacterium]
MAEGGLGERVALVTGASRRGGIGAAICRALAADGADVVFTHWHAYDRAFHWGADEDGPPTLRSELRGLGIRAEDLEIDLGVPEAAGRVLDAATERLGLPTILINNAAHSTNGGYEILDATALDAHYAVNVRTTALLCAEFARRHAAAGRTAGGRIVNLTSGQSRGPMPDELAYAASKGAVEAFTVSLAPAVARLGITVNAVNPGPTDSGWMTDEIKATLLPRFPFGRLGQPADAARLIAFLASDAGAWITGQILHSEGGFER